MSKFQYKYYLLENRAILISSEDSFFTSKKKQTVRSRTACCRSRILICGNGKKNSMKPTVR